MKLEKIFTKSFLPKSNFSFIAQELVLLITRLAHWLKTRTSYVMNS
jgi:hypothetical protein